MIATLRAEFRKLLTVRSTYIVALFAFVLLGFVAFYGEGYKGSVQTGLAGSLFLAGSITQHSGVLGVFGAIVALMLMTHEYRYNTIAYALTITNRRTKVLLAKIIVVLTYVLVIVLVGGALGLLSMVLGQHLAGHSLPHQDISYMEYLGKMLFYCEGWGLTALLLGVLLRNQIAAFAVLFIAPNTVEGLLSLLLKKHAVYLPFTALAQVISPPTVGNAVNRVSALGALSPVKGGLVFGAYLIAGWLVAWQLFIRRDAN